MLIAIVSIQFVNFTDFPFLVLQTVIRSIAVGYSDHNVIADRIQPTVYL